MPSNRVRDTANLEWGLKVQYDYIAKQGSLLSHVQRVVRVLHDLRDTRLPRMNVRMGAQSWEVLARSKLGDKK